MACVGGGSNSIGLFSEFLADEGVAMVGVEAGGEGVASGRHAARFAGGAPGVFQGTLTQILQDAHGNILTTHSVSAGLDYPAVGPEHSRLQQMGRVKYVDVGDGEALAGFHFLARREGIIPALEPSHAVAWVMRKDALEPEELVIINLSGRGDKDLDEVARQGGMGA